jgi:hypothetical protein
VKHRSATLLFGAALLAGCSVPTLGTVTPAPQAKTAPESQTISPACRTQLEALSSDTLAAYDVGMAGLDAHVLEDPVTEAANLHAALLWGAQAEGVTDCD